MVHTNNTAVTADDVIEIVRLFERHGVELHIDGGWAVDALLGRQYRSHSDLDIAIKHKDVAAARSFLRAAGFREVPRKDSRECNFVLMDERKRQIDVHTYTFDENQNHVFGIAYPYDSLTGTGTIGNQPVKCISADWLVKFHTGYTPDDDDYHDVRLLCEHFQIALPEEFQHFEKRTDSELPQ